jgi:protein-S-isoprenylcysteine O-methyltransferase Ste14
MTTEPRRPGLILKVGGAAAGVLGLAGLAAFGGLVLVLGTGWLPHADRLPEPWPWVVDLGWLFAFGLQHSGMARAGFKYWWTRQIPAPLERSCYVASSGALGLGLAWTWQPVGGDPWWQGPRWLSVVPVLAALGTGWICWRFDTAAFLGLRQAWTAGQEGEPDQLSVEGAYRYVRHPLMAGMLMLLWLHPVMTPTLALLSGGLTLYIAVGTYLEERDLLRRFGAAYAAYRQRVPALIPWRRPS